MEDLLQSQIQDSCRLALPEGLQDLMCDISREVLRAQPSDLYKFIVDYLAALLLARDTLPIACQVCHGVCGCSCEPLLEEELRNIGLDGDDLDIAKNVVMDHFAKAEVNEGSLLMKLFNKTKIEDNMLPAIQEAVRTAFLRHRQEQSKETKVKPQGKNKEGAKAAQQTLRFYEKSNDEAHEARHAAATKIQRQVKKKSLKAETVRKPKSHTASVSSTSLAGSYINLPKYIPYSAHNFEYADFEYHDAERNTIDYTHSSHFVDSNVDDEHKIVFFEHHAVSDIESCLMEEEDVEENVPEEIEEEVNSIASSVEEGIIPEKTPIKVFVGKYIVDEDKKGIKKDSLTYEDKVNRVDETHNHFIINKEVSEENLTEIKAISIEKKHSKSKLEEPGLSQGSYIGFNEAKYEKDTKVFSDEVIEDENEIRVDDGGRLQDMDRNVSNIFKRYISGSFNFEKSELHDKLSQKKISDIHEEIIGSTENTLKYRDVMQVSVSDNEMTTKESSYVYLNPPSSEISDQESFHSVFKVKWPKDIMIKPSNFKTKEVGSNESFFLQKLHTPDGSLEEE